MKPLQAILSGLWAIWGVSCVLYQDKATSSNGNSETTTYASIGGTGTVTGANGNHMTHDHQQSLRDVATAVGTGYSVGQTSKATINAANNKTTQQANTLNAQTTQAKNASDASSAAAKTAASKDEFNTAVGAGATPTVGTVPAIQP